MKVTPDANAIDGTNHALTQEEWDAGLTHVLRTGPINGTIVLRDGSAYDVGPYHIAIKPEHREEMERAIHQAHHSAGRFLDVPLPSE